MTRSPVDVDTAVGRPYDCLHMSGDALAAGSELFGYVIQRVLGRGGMGTVYLANQTSLRRQVALKVLHPSRIRSAQQVEQFLKEAQSAGRFSHPHLVMVHDAHVDRERGLYCYSMEYVPGRTLSKLVQERGVLPTSASLHLTYQIAKALAHAHRHGLVHRDVKPDNILVADNGLAKLADLGLVRDRLEGVGAAASQTLSIVGTPDYAAPEQSRNPKRAVPASDVYGLGACLYFALLGRPPFTGETVIDVIVRAATEPPDLPATLQRPARALLTRLLAKRPQERFEDGQSLVDALDELARSGEIGDPADEGEGEGDDTQSDEDAVDGEGGEASTRGSARFRRIRRRRRR